MPSATLTVSGDIGGVVMNSTLQRTADGQIGQGPVTVAAAKAGTLDTRSTDTTGIIGSTAHGMTDGDVMDIYWDGGRRYDVDVVAGTDTDNITFSGGTGDVLPAATTAVTVQEQLVIDIDFVGDNLKAIGALCTKRGHISFRDSGGSTLLSVDLIANEAWFWLDGGTAVNPLAGDTVADLVYTQSDSANTATTRVGVLYDSTP